MGLSGWWEDVWSPVQVGGWDIHGGHSGRGLGKEEGVQQGFCLEASPFPDANPSAWAALQQWSTVPTVRKVTTDCVWVGSYWTRIVQVQASPPCKLSVLENN